MTDLLPRPATRTRSRAPRPVLEDRINRRGSLEPREPGRPRRSLVVALVLACVTLMTLDHVGGATAARRSTRCAGWSARSTGRSRPASTACWAP